MDHLWSPWRYRYLTEHRPSDACLFCEARDGPDAEHLVVHRGKSNLVMLNLYPYTSGHLMIAPYEHVASLDAAAEETAAEMMRLVRESEKKLRAIYHPDGLNIGMNIGSAAGAGVAGHIHMHVVQRWAGDSNFMTTIGETRVMPEDLGVTYQKLTQAWRL